MPPTVRASASDSFIRLELNGVGRYAPSPFLPKKYKPGNILLSHSAARAVPSAPKGLASVFGMGTGVSPSSWLPGFVNKSTNNRWPKPAMRAAILCDTHEIQENFERVTNGRAAVSALAFFA